VSTEDLVGVASALDGLPLELDDARATDGEQVAEALPVVCAH
jgi:hypothetical protein